MKRKVLMYGAAVLAVLVASCGLCCFFFSGINIFELGIADRLTALSSDGERAVIVIDPGHGGMDGGASSPAGIQEKDITESYNNSNGKCAETQELKTEMGVLSIAGISKTLKAPMKIVWFNQTRVLRFFTTVDNDLLIKKYVETVIRRTFGTENAMKLGKPIPDGQ